MSDWTAIASVGAVIAGIAGAIKIYRDLAELLHARQKRKLERDKSRLLEHAHKQAEQVPSASTLIEVGFEVKTKGERRAARALVMEGRASLHGNTLMVAIDRMPAIFRQGLGLKGDWL